MKRIIIAAALVLGFTVAASAQPRAIGGRFGYGVDLSYQHYVGGDNFVEADLGLDSFKFLNVAATYNFMISEFGDGFGFYAGPGAGVGLAVGDINYLALSAAGMVGIEYNFNFPLQISLDFRQHVGLGFNGHGLWTPSSIGLGIRYQF